MTLHAHSAVPPTYSLLCAFFFLFFFPQFLCICCLCPLLSFLPKCSIRNDKKEREKKKDREGQKERKRKKKQVQVIFALPHFTNSEATLSLSSTLSESEWVILQKGHVSWSTARCTSYFPYRPCQLVRARTLASPAAHRNPYLQAKPSLSQVPLASSFILVHIRSTFLIDSPLRLELRHIFF